MAFTRKTATATTLALALAAAPLSAVSAQEAQAQPTGEAAPAAQAAEATTAIETPSFEEAQLDAFASAVLEIREIRADYAAQVEAADTPKAQTALVAEANAKMQDVIETRESFTLDDYVAINRAAAADPELNAEIAARLKTLEDARDEAKDAG
ncbi:DUF4168 domain-containing protein [Litorisediminicola beolgyonensis]|uniref:DUF4168 domain-containing protein n=1 Tax=Litorisediminicola beolgyonensis TaxID=1173614 RepID=A0ABW3ZKN1_9RHOB